MAAEPDLHPLIMSALVALVVVVFVALVVLFFGFVKLYRIPSSAMEPTLRCGRPALGCSGQASDHVVALRLRWPSMTRKCTRTVSPALNLGRPSRS